MCGERQQAIDWEAGYRAGVGSIEPMIDALVWTLLDSRLPAVPGISVRSPTIARGRLVLDRPGYVDVLQVLTLLARGDLTALTDRLGLTRAELRAIRDAYRYQVIPPAIDILDAIGDTGVMIGTVTIDERRG